MPKKPYSTINLLSRKAKDQRQAQAMQSAINEGTPYAFKKKSKAPTTVSAGSKDYTATGRGTTMTSGTMTTTETNPGKEYKMTVTKPSAVTPKKTFTPGDMQGGTVHDRKSHMGMSKSLNEKPAKTQARIDEQEKMESKSKLGMLTDEDENKVKSGYSTPTQTKHGGKEYYGKITTTTPKPETKDITIKTPGTSKEVKKPYVKITSTKPAAKSGDRDLGSKRSHVSWLDSKKETKPFTSMTNKSTSSSKWSGSSYRFNKKKRIVQ